MNGTPSTDNPERVQSGDASDGGNAARSRVDRIADAWLILAEAAEGDVDLTKAAEKVAQWLARVETPRQGQ